MDKVVIIGSGLGGLECGYILARNGLDVTVLEKEPQIGGCLQTFRRGGLTFDTGFHYVGGLGEGEPLWRLFRYFGLLDLPWESMDPECFDEVSFSDGESCKCYPFANGHDRFVERLSEFFPSEGDGLRRYASFLRGVGERIFSPIVGACSMSSLGGAVLQGLDLRPSGGMESGSSSMNELFGQSAKAFLEETIENPMLRKVLSGANLKLELGENLPLYVYAQISNSFILSAWRLRGGGSQIAARLADGIRAEGGRVLSGHEVVSINPLEDAVKSVTVRLADGTECEFAADWVISDAHPSVTVAMIGECRAARRIWRHRMAGLPNTYGMATANIALRKSSIPYLASNLYVHRSSADLWRPSLRGTDSVMVHCYPPSRSEVPHASGKEDYATHLDVMTPMDVGSLEGWRGGSPMRRGEEYEALKKAKLDEAIDLAAIRIQGLREAISSVWMSSPLTWRSYTGTPEGSAYGVRKDFSNPMLTVLSPRTPLRNLFLTGQSLNLHGILGTSMTALLTCLSIPFPSR